ncbi:MAG TPA: hypothetical protein GX707_15515 [Epulopiscium sp.]|nr:hypothetical protein [Candidatus Epulonipiscium sp.]
MRTYKKYIASLILIILSVTYVWGLSPSPQGFKIISEDYVESMDSNVITYQHRSTGAQVIHVKNTDPNQVFAIGFKTPIHDNTGVNHIVEHTVFTGSEKYNIKDVFFEMKKKSPNIFMNASTAADMTVYPFSTRNEKDYNNLLDIYLDAVFFPNLQKHRYGFDQEGWHYSVDKDEKFHLSGVVYNEMKGASVAPRRILTMANRTAMFPDTMYIYNAGGSPGEIPDLTYEAFKETHKEYYIPSNSCAFIYGDVDIEPVLAKLDSYYKRFKKGNNQNISQKQQPFGQMSYYTDYYPAISVNESYYMSTNFAVGGIEDIKLQISMGILMDILIQYEQSPLRKAFREKQSSKALSYDIDSAIPQPMYSIIATDVKKEDIQNVERLIKETLAQSAKEGFHRDLIKMAVNNYEINTKQRASDISKGIDMAYSAIYSWGHGVSPVKMLQGQDFIEQIKKEGDSLYFQELLKTHLLHNNHTSQVVLVPDENHITKAQNQETRKIELEEVSNDQDAIKVLMDNQTKLEQWQQEKGRIESLPQLNLKDINQSISLPQLTIKENKTGKKMYYLADTNDLIYMDLYFDTAYIPQESLNDLFLFADLISQKEKDLVALYTGGMSCSPIAIQQFEWYNKYDPKLKLAMCAEKDNIGKAFEILEQVTKEEEWDEKWVLTQIHKVRNQYENYFNANPLELMNVAIGSTQDGASRYEYEKVIPYYRYICEIEENYDQYKDQVINKLNIINNSIFNKNQLVLGATLEEKNIKTLEKNYIKYRKNLKDDKYPKAIYHFAQKEKKQGFSIASDVQYIMWGGSYKEKGGTYDGALYVLSNILNSEYMLQNIRVKNGAYGAGIKFNPYGDMMIYTYQDPKLAESLQIIEDIPKYIAEVQMDENTLDDYKIGAFSKFEQELGLNNHPAVIGETLQRYNLSGLRTEALEKVREEIFRTNIKDIKNQGLVLEKVIKDRRYSVAGSNRKLLTNSTYFDIIQSFQSR